MIRYADWEMRGELARIWQTCFDEPARPAKYFLNNYFRPENSLVYQIREKTAAVVYLLPAEIVTERGSAQAHYIYAAATLPQYRSRGFMKALLAAAALVGTRRGDQYSVLKPANKGLYSFYQKSEYVSFFQVDYVTLMLEELCTLAESGVGRKTIVPIHELNTLRNRKLTEKVGSVLWSDEAFGFSVGIGGVYGDRLVTSLTESRPAYALCRRIDQDTVAIQELMADVKTLPDIAASLIQEFPASKYRFRLSIGYRLSGRKGETVPFGMVKPIGGAVLEPIRPHNEAAYLGLSLD